MAQTEDAIKEHLSLNKPIPARRLHINETKVEQSGMPRIREQRAVNVEQGLPPMAFDKTLKDEPIALVGYGPSLNATWERLKDYKVIWSCSKAHDFLLEKGLKPQCHFDLDPRAYKADFLTKPQPDVKYYLSTHIHPSYIEKLKAAGCQAYLFHSKIEPHIKLDPRYPELKVRFDVGVQMAEGAYLNGYRTQHWFGIEYGHEANQTHAGKHWGVSTTMAKCQVDVDGRIFESNAMFFHGLLLAEQFLCDRASIKITIHGDGLLPNFIKCRGRVPRLKHII